MCREEGSDLSLLHKEGKLGDAALVGVIKEVAIDAAADEALDVKEFQTKYFPHPVYLDKDLEFYKALGSRSILGSLSWNPFTLWSKVGEMKDRMKAKKIKGNYAGEGLTAGGIHVYSKEKGLVYTYEEEIGQQIPAGAIIEAIKKL